MDKHTINQRFYRYHRPADHLHFLFLIDPVSHRATALSSACCMKEAIKIHQEYEEVYSKVIVTPKLYLAQFSQN